MFDASGLPEGFKMPTTMPDGSPFDISKLNGGQQQEPLDPMEQLRRKNNRENYKKMRGLPSMKMLTICITTYNRPDLLEKALADLCAIQQNPPLFKVLVVDDCSSVEYNIPDEVIKKLDLKYIKLKKNGGPGVARQSGIDNCDTTWITFMDDDDKIGTNINTLIQAELYQDNFKLIRTPFAEVDGDNISTVTEDISYNHGKVFNMTTIKKYHIHFPDFRVFEDVYFNLSYFFICEYEKTVRDCDYSFYGYLENKESITRKQGIDFMENNFEFYCRARMDPAKMLLKKFPKAFEVLRIHLLNVMADEYLFIQLFKYRKSKNIERYTKIVRDDLKYICRKLDLDSDGLSRMVYGNMKTFEAICKDFHNRFEFEESEDIHKFLGRLLR